MRPRAAYSKVSAYGRTVLPRAVREALRIRPGDTLCYRVTEAGVLIDKAPSHADDPFAIFTEWSDAADDEAYANL